VFVNVRFFGVFEIVRFFILCECFMCKLFVRLRMVVVCLCVQGFLLCVCSSNFERNSVVIPIQITCRRIQQMFDLARH